MKDKEVYAWEQCGKIFCKEVFGPGVITYTKDQVIEKILHQEIPNKCSTCGEVFVSQDDLMDAAFSVVLLGAYHRVEFKRLYPDFLGVNLCGNSGDGMGFSAHTMIKLHTLLTKNMPLLKEIAELENKKKQDRVDKLSRSSS